MSVFEVDVRHGPAEHRSQSDFKVNTAHRERDRNTKAHELAFSNFFCFQTTSI